MPPKGSGLKKLYGVVKKDNRFWRLGLRDRKQLYVQLSRERARGAELASLTAAAIDKHEPLHEAQEDVARTAPTYYWLGVCSIDDDKSVSAFPRVTALVGHYPEEASDALCPRKVDCYSINGVLIGDCKDGEIYQGKAKDISTDDPFVVVRENRNPGYRRDSKAPSFVSQYDTVPLIPKISEREFDQLEFAQELQISGPPPETLKVLIQCIDGEGQTLFFEEIVESTARLTPELIIKAAENQISIEEEGLEAEIWVLPQRNGVKEVYRWSERSISSFLSAKQEALYMQVLLLPKRSKKKEGKVGSRKRKR